MKVDVQKDDKLVLVWLSKAEKEEAYAQQELQQIISDYRKSKFRIVVMHSGYQDLTEHTMRLLSENLC